MQSPNDSTPQTLLAAVRHFTPETAEQYIESIKWADGAPCCAKCGSVNVRRLRTRAVYQCRDCRKQSSLIIGTIMEGTHLRLDQWCVAVWMLVNCRLGVSSCEISRTIGCKQQSAWHLLHRARRLFDPVHTDQMQGVCEADETFVGGILKFMSRERRRRAIARGRLGKATVHAIKSRRTGLVRAEVISAPTTEHVRTRILRHVQRGSRLYTDEATIYKWAEDSWYMHRTVNHTERYVDGACHTNGCENFFNCLRRSFKGTYIKPTPEHLPAYVNEAAYRFNVRHLTEWQRFDRAMQCIVGKRLTYSELTDGAKR